MAKGYPQNIRRLCKDRAVSYCRKLLHVAGIPAGQAYVIRLDSHNVTFGVAFGQNKIELMEAMLRPQVKNNYLIVDYAS